ncbi:sugar transferase [Candidatus Microgenomates bacterium]|nr:sugar transferase [Candidatus Microgenomates bacterium]
MFYDSIKRVLDVTLAIILLLIFSPFMLLIAFLIKFTSPGPILAQTPLRVGKDGELFRLYKFRSMIANAHDLLTHDPKFKKLYDEYKKSSYKLRNDPRITPVGNFLRHHSLDELPQLFNVLNGEMSLIGPRPYYEDELVEQQKKYPETSQLVKEVISIRPGITGLWQVSGRSEVNFDKRIRMDAKYARSKSLWLDFVILLKSPWIMLTGKGAV